MRQNSAEERKETGRVEAFSDGVFSIAITLLVLTISIPTIDSLQNPPQTLSHYIVTHGSEIATYVISFITILVMWINHHSIFQFVRRIDRLFVVANGLLLMSVTFVNVPTALVANFIATPDAQFAAGFYSATLVVTSMFFNLVWHRAVDGHRLIPSRIDQQVLDTISRQYFFGPLLYGVAFVAAFFSAWVSVALNAALAIFFLFTGRLTYSPPDEDEAVYEARVRDEKRGA